MAAMKLSAQPREDTGKGAARKLRQSGKIPAVLYGRGEASAVLTLAEEEVTDLLAGGSATTSVIRLEISDAKKGEHRNVLIKEIQRHPYRGTIYHMDLQEVAMDETVMVKVPVETTGEAEGVKIGGILEFKRRELDVICLPDRIPDVITIDISDLHIGDVVHVEDLKVPDGVEIPHDVNFTILTLVGAKAEEEPEEVEEEIEGEEAEPEVISKGKAEEEEEPAEE